MSLYLVKVTMGGNCRDIWVKAADESRAAEEAQARLNWGGRVESVKWIRRECGGSF